MSESFINHHVQGGFFAGCPNGRHSAKLLPDNPKSHVMRIKLSGQDNVIA